MVLIALKNTNFGLLGEFPLKWRWTDEKWSDLSVEDLKKIRPLKLDKSNEIYEVSSPYFFPNCLNENEFIAVERFDTSNERGEKTIHWLRNKFNNVETDLLVSWDKNTAALVSSEIFCEFWDDFCYPGSDDISIFPLNVQWILGYFHDEYFEFGRLKN